MFIPKTSLEQWAVLATVVDQDGYAQAAGQLHRSQSSVSYAIARLQESLEVELLRIEGRKAVLTPHGKALLQRARALLRDAATLETLAGSLKRGWEPELRLVVDAAFPRARLLQIVGELRQLCPTTQLQLADAVLSGAEEAIVDGTADVVVTTRVPPGFLGDWLLDVTFTAVAHPGHPLFALDRPLTADDLVRHAQAVVRDSGQRQSRDAGWLGANQRYTVSSIEASLAIVQAGFAYAWLPQHLIDEPLHRGDLRVLPLTASSTRRMPLYVVLVRAELAGPAARAVVESFQRHVPATGGRTIV
jgi:DNA-binding transcriptional LysR family regulator